MGANAQTTVQKFVDGAVLTAAQQNTSAATGVPVFATTVTRDAAFGGANKVLAEGQTCYLESTNVVQYYDGAAWATVGPAAAAGLTLISRTTPAAATTLAFDGVFSSTYSAYLVTLEDIFISSQQSLSFNMRYGSTTNTNASWFGGVAGSQANSAVFGNNSTNGGTSFLLSSAIENTKASGAVINVSGVGVSGKQPQVLINIAAGLNGVYRTGNATLQSTAQTWTGFILVASGGNITGTIGIYGLASA